MNKSDYELDRATEAFFVKHQSAYPLYRLFYDELLTRFPETETRVQKTQISFYNRHLFACASFMRVRRKAELPEGYFVLTLGLNRPLESDRVAVKTEPYPGRWTTHLVIGDPAELDEELFGWVAEAYDFALNKYAPDVFLSCVEGTSGSFPPFALTARVGPRALTERKAR